MNNKYKKIYILTKEIENKTLIDLKQFFIDNYKKETILLSPNDENIEYNEQNIYFLYLDDISVKQFIKLNIDMNIHLSILPNKMCPQSILRYGISRDIYEAIDDSFNSTLRVDDQLLLCNGDLVFQKISIGNVNNLNKNIEENSIYENFKIFIKNLSNLKYQNITMKTSKENIIQTVISGILVLEDYTIFNNLTKSGKTSFHDGKLNAFIIAPYSLISYLYYLINIFLYHKFSFGSLPKNIGFIATSQLILSSDTSFDFTIDDISLSAKNIELKVYQSKLNISYGKKFQEAIEEKNITDDKETVNIKYLPKGEINELLIKGKVPIFKKASDEDMKETLTSIKSSANVTSIFITLMILSTLLATVGIFQDSTPSVIGAMILAPLMAPIISLAMGAARSDKLIISRSITTLSFGIFSALLFSALLTIILPLEIVTSQINSRVNPNLLDLFVAIFSGIAGAYATAKEEVAKSLAGVAIAVALVPPLAVTGIGIGWGDINIIYGSFLLFLTNLFGVTLAASLTFIVLGFAPIHRAKKGLAFSSLLLSIISIPLIISFYSLILQSNDYAKFHGIQTIMINDKKVQLNITNIKSSTKESTNIELEVISNTSLSDSELNQLQQIVETKINKKVVLEIVTKIIKE